MAKHPGGSRNWERRGRLLDLTTGARQNTERVKSLLAARFAVKAPTRLSRPGLATSSVQRYATTAAPTAWTLAGRGRPITDAILDAVEDGVDRVILAWPFSPYGGFLSAAIALREARASGRLAHATLGLWPWRNGATWRARSVLLHPGDVHGAATHFATELQSPKEWADPTLAHQSQYLLELRLGDLVVHDGRDLQSPTERSILVRSPTLLETTSVFPPNPGRGDPYVADPKQVLRRVRDHTRMGDKNAGLVEHVAAAGDPNRVPFALFGIPAEAQTTHFKRYLSFARFGEKGLDAIVVDLTRNGRSELPDEWEKRFAVFLEGLEFAPDRRPSVVVVAEDIFTVRRATRALKAYGAKQRPRRAYIEGGAYLPEPGLLGPSVDLTHPLPPVRFEADIKDAALAPLRQSLVRLGRELRQGGHALAADGVSKALALLRRSASLPIGLEEARGISDILFDGGDEVDDAARSLFRPKMALAPLAAVQVLAPSFGEAAKRLVSEIGAKLALWAAETPVSAKLSTVLEDPAWNSVETLISVSDRRLVDVFLGSDRARLCRCAVIDHQGLRAEFERKAYTRLILLGPTPDAVKTLLTSWSCPPQVLLLGDAAGSALVIAEVNPIGRITAFAPVANRARELATALTRGGADEQLDLAEAEFRIAATIPEGQIDFTQAGENYKGDVIHLSTAHGHRLAYRPASDVLRYSPGEARPFEKVAARDVARGDRILVLNATIREPIRRALAGSREVLSQLQLYHDRINAVVAETSGLSTVDKARTVLAEMRRIEPSISPTEVQNIARWLTAGQPSVTTIDGARQPRAARDWDRFKVFMQAVGVPEDMASVYWLAAVVPARSYRAQEGYFFNQRVVQFIRDPEGASVGTSAWSAMQGLWQQVLDAVDEVVSSETIRSARNG